VRFHSFAIFSITLKIALLVKKSTPASALFPSRALPRPLRPTPHVLGRTFYVRFGDWFILASLLGLIAFAVIRPSSRRRGGGG